MSARAILTAMINGESDPLRSPTWPKADATQDPDLAQALTDTSTPTMPG